MSKALERNIGYLTVLRRKSSRTAKPSDLRKIDRVVNLYTERKISNVTTAENLIKGLTSTDTKVYDKAYQKYKDNIKKFKENKPLNQRMAEVRAYKEAEGKEYKKRGMKKKNTYFVTCDLYIIGDKEKTKSKPAFKAFGKYYYLWNYERLRATIQMVGEEFPKELIRKRILKKTGVINSDDDLGEYEETNPEFTKIINIMRNDEDFDTHVQHLNHQEYGLDGIKILSVEMMNKSGEKFDILTENLRDASNVSIYHKYIHTPIKMSEDTIQKAIKHGNYIKNECWINSLIDFYSDTIMNERTRNRLTRDKIIEIIGRDDFKEVGATIKEMEAIFMKFNIQVRIFHFVNELIYKYDPEKRNHHIKTFYAMVKNNHIYTLNHDLSKIQQKQLVSKLPTIKARTDYYINEREEPPQYKMIKCIDDILKIKTDDKTKEVHLVPENNNLAELLFQLLNSGYEPRIKYTSIVDEIRVKFNKITYIIKTQNLIKSSSDGWIAVSNETTYNNMNKAMFNFNKPLFIPSHKSFYNDIDIKILNESRTVAPSGLLWEKFHLRGKTEIDENKAYSKGFINITEIPVFNQLDHWKPYNNSIDINELHELTLYYVETQGSNKSLEDIQDKIRRLKKTNSDRLDIINKLEYYRGHDAVLNYLEMYKQMGIKFVLEPRELEQETQDILIKSRLEYNLIYGKFLKEFINENKNHSINILYYKQPSFIHKVDYKSIIDELWKTVIDEDDRDLDKIIKK